jgi:hypothetical protein
MNKIYLLLILNLLFSGKTLAYNLFEYKWTNKHPVLTKYIKKNKAKIIKNSKHKLKKSSKYLDRIEEIFKEEGVPPEIAILAGVESDFNPTAVSKANAIGMWQFKKATAVEWGLRVDDVVDERLDWEKSTRTAAKYLKWLAMDNFNGNYESAILSYNSGVTNIKNIMNLMDIEDPWVIIEYGDIVTKESREFLPKFIIYMNYFYYLKNKEKGYYNVK